MSNKWFKFYGGEYLSDQKIERLNPIERSCWVTLMCLASMNDSGDIKHLTVQTLLNKSGIQFDPYHPEEWESALSILDKLESLDMIQKIDVGIIRIINWDKRQESNLTGAERVAKSRRNKNVTNDVTNVTLEENRIEENRIDNSNVRVSKKEKLNSSYDVMFEQFWKVYPEKIAKGKAYEVWQLLEENTKSECLTAIQNQVQNRHFYKDWLRKDSAPHPTTWLNQKRWEDVVTAKTPKSEHNALVTSHTQTLIESAKRKTIKL